MDVVLVRPARAANVAAACRAMKNMGLGRLRMVGRPPGLDGAEARSLAYGAWDVLDGAVSASSMAEAVADRTFVAATTGRPLRDAWTPRRLAEEAGPRSRGGGVALVFGPESSGLTNQELALCHARVHVPTSPEHPSLNLAQAVLIMAYEMRLAALADEGGGPPGPEPAPAPVGEVEEAVQDLRAGLLEIGYLNPANPEAVLAELRGLIFRAAPTSREVSLLRGLARQIAWAGKKARGGTAIG